MLVSDPGYEQYLLYFAVMEPASLAGVLGICAKMCLAISGDAGFFISMQSTQGWEVCKAGTFGGITLQKQQRAQLHQHCHFPTAMRWDMKEF